LVILGPFLFVIGVWQFASAPFDHQRENNLQQMNEAIKIWSVSYKDFFAAEQFSVSSASQNQWTDLNQDNKADFSTADLNPYTAVKFTQSSTNIIGSWRWKEGQNFTMKFQARGNITGTFSLNLELFSVDSTSESSSSCESSNGEYSDSRCYHYYVLSGVCVKVSEQNGLINYDTTNGGPGCEYSNGFPADSGRWIPSQYIKVPYSQGQVIDRLFSFSVPITVRHQKDPYVFAEQLTQGTLQFGLTPGQKLGVGVVLMVIGGFFILPCVGFAILFAVCFRRRRHGGSYHQIHHHSSY